MQKQKDILPQTVGWYLWRIHLQYNGETVAMQIEFKNRVLIKVLNLRTIRKIIFESNLLRVLLINRYFNFI